MDTKPILPILITGKLAKMIAEKAKEMKIKPQAYISAVVEHAIDHSA